MAPDEVATKMIFQEQYLTLCQYIASRASGFTKVAEDPLNSKIYRNGVLIQPSISNRNGSGERMFKFAPTPNCAGTRLSAIVRNPAIAAACPRTLLYRPCCRLRDPYR